MRNQNGWYNFVIIALVSLLFIGTNVHATNGYFSHGYGTQYKAMAGSGVALSLSALAPATNPASNAFLGKRVDLGFALFNPNREYSVTGNPSGFPQTFPLTPGTIKSDSKYFIIPSVGANVSLPGGHNLGLAIYGNGGMNTNYDTKTFNSPLAPVTQPTGVDLTQLFVAGTYAREIVPNHAIGLSGIFAYQRFKAEGLQAFGGFSADPTKLTNNDYSSSTGFGARIGYLGHILPVLSIGASYQTKMSMSALDDYAGLFAEQGNFDIPATWTAGVAVKATSILTVALDVQQILYSQVKSIHNPMLPNLQNALLSDDNGAGFGWKDMTIVKVGAQLKPMPGLALRAGYSQGKQPIPDSEVMFNILAPGVIEQHATFGFSKALMPMLQLNFAFMYAFSNTVSGANPLEAPNQQKIELKMNQIEAELGLSFSL